MSSSCASSVPRAAITTYMAGAEGSHEMRPETMKSFHSPTPFGTLIIIPAELRLKIYGALIERGQVAILGTSRAINTEAFADLYKYAVCRVKINYGSWFTLYPIQLPCNNIQYLELRLEANHRGITHLNEWLQRFSPDKTDLKICDICLDFEYNFIFIPEDFTTISALTAYQKVTFVIAGIKRDTIPSLRAFASSHRSDLDRDIWQIMRCDIPEDDLQAYEWAVGFLERTLGSAECFDDHRGMRLEFYPQRSSPLTGSENEDSKAEEEY